MKQKIKDQKHMRCVAWGPTIAQTIGSISGLLALAILVMLAWHMSDRNQGPEAATIVTTGAVSIVAVFVTGKVAQAKGAGSRGGGRPTKKAAAPPPERSP
ncbi:hypothetical protein [Streptomyces sp. YS-3]|uniref:hypothetical protein n=1 Tax=Streptomyces sp. YS-3 TaxID=3381352 RepID=UPI00386286C1